jgi:hypothetical protein
MVSLNLNGGARMDKIAAYGALTGTAGLILHYIKHRKDRPIIKIKLSVLKRDDKSVEIDATISNEGHRPITVKKCHFINCGDMAKNGAYNINPPKELTENTSHTCGVLSVGFHEKKISPKNIYAYIEDTMGKCYWSDNIIMRKTKTYRYNQKHNIKP